MNIATQSQPLTVPAFNLKLETWNQAFSAYLTKNYRNAHSRALAHQHVRVFSRWYEKEFKQAFEPSLLTNYDLHLFRAASLKNKKANTWNSRLWALNILCAWIGRASLLDDIAGQDYQGRSEKHRSLTDNEYHRLIHKLELDVTNPRVNATLFEQQSHARIWASVMLMLHGLRVEEVEHLEVGDITLKEKSGSVLIRCGKGGKQGRVQINKFGRKALESFLQVRADSASNNLFGVSKRTLQRSVEELGKQIGVPDLTCHWLRYTFAKRLQKLGLSDAEICEHTRHGSIAALQRYLRSSAEDLQSAVEGVM